MKMHVSTYTYDVYHKMQKKKQRNKQTTTCTHPKGKKTTDHPLSAESFFILVTEAAWSEGFNITPATQPMSEGHLCWLLLFGTMRSSFLKV